MNTTNNTVARSFGRVLRKSAAGFAVFIVGIALTGLTAVPAVAAPRLPIEAFAALPLVQSAALSPDGLKVAMMVNNEGTTSIVVQHLVGADSKKVSLMSSDNTQYNFNWFRWVTNERILVSTRFPAKRVSRWAETTVGGIETYETRLLSAKIDGSTPLNLFKPTSFAGPMQAQQQDRVIDFDVDGGKHILVNLADPEFGGEPGVYSVDVETGTRALVHKQREMFYSWRVDRNHTVRIGVRYDKNNVEVHACDPDGKNWRKLWAYKVLGKDEVEPIGFGKDPNELYVEAPHNGRRALFTVDLRDAALTKKLKLSSDKYDVSGSLIYSKLTGEAIGLRSGAGLGQSDANYWDTDKKELLGFIDKALPERFNQLSGTSANEEQYLVYSSASNIAAQYFIGDDRANTLKPLAITRPGLPKEVTVAKRSVSITARDGLKLPAFLSLPEGQASKNLPLVMYVHGGPQSRTDAGFDEWTQFFANRGYAVLEVNFRGSTGYGEALLASGLRRWGAEMQDDLTDGVAWAVKEGYADPKRVCIVGASYGGYAALMGVAKTPDLYRCAVSFAGVTDLYELGRDNDIYDGGKEIFEAQIGSIDTEQERLKATSPRYLAKQIKVPVLLVHGTQDRSVKYYQAELMDKALTEAGKPHKFITQVRGDHHLSLYSHSLEFFKAMEAFLAQNLGAAN